jgi:isoquinoline 1-oxidoreductase beta subunit
MVTRRSVLAGMVSAGAFVLAARVLPHGVTVEHADAATAWQPSVYLGLEPDGSVVIVAHRSEMGTGIRTSLPVVVADELEADWKRVRIEQALGDAKYGSQNTDGSRSISDFWDTMRETGATARTMLERAAAERWGVPAAECRARNHEVVHEATKRTLPFGDLVAAAAKQPVPKREELRLKTPSEFRYIGTSVPIADLHEISAGTAVFGIDAKLPGMVYASVERSPVFGGSLKRVDDTAAKSVRGVTGTVTIPAFKPPHMFQPLGGVAVVANNSWAALRGRKQLVVEWDNGPNANANSKAYMTALRETVRTPQKVARNVGDVDAVFAKGGKVVEAEYSVPILAHAPMEPPAAVAEVKDGRCLVYSASQDPQAVQDTVAAALGIDKSRVEVRVTLLGGGFGRKSKPDYVAEAALVSRAVGKPVKIVWSREDDVRFDFYHAPAAMYMKAALDEKGRPAAWLQRSAFPTIMSTFNPAADAGQEFELAMGWTDVPFDLPNHRVENGPAKNPVRIGWLRSVSNIYHAFGVQSFADELAHAAGRDPVDYLLELIGPARKVDLRAQGVEYSNYGHSLEHYPIDTARFRRVVELAAEKSGWAKRSKAKGHGLGIAVHRSFCTYVATVVAVEVDDRGRVTIPRVDMAVDAGTVVNPDRVRSQLEGAAVFGTSIALLSGITLGEGRVEQSNFFDYKVARMTEAPRETFVHIVPSAERPAGVGEPGVPPIPPAICSAIFAATGTRVRDLPIARQLVPKA